MRISDWSSDVCSSDLLTTDIDEQEAQTAHQALKSDCPEVELVLQVNRGLYPNSRVDNLMGGIFSAGKDYIAIVDDDDFVALDAFSSFSIARFLGPNPLLLLSSQFRNETWCEAATGRGEIGRATGGQRGCK